MSYSVFLSHSSRDRSWVNSISKQAELFGIATYMYEHDPQPGKALRSKLEGEIRRSDAVVVLLTKQGAASRTVQQEVGIAIGLKKLIIPMVEKGAKDKLALLAGLEYIPLDSKKPHEAMSQLMGQLNRERARHSAQEIALLFALGALIVLAATSE